MAGSESTVWYYLEYGGNIHYFGTFWTASDDTVGSLYFLENNEEPSKNGFVFCGWSLYDEYDSSSGTYGADISNQPVTNYESCTKFLAIWEKSIPTITFDANSGTFPTSGETQTAYNSTELTGSTALSSIVETPTKPGYVFKGWSTTSTGSVQYTQASMPTISSDTTLYAIYEPDTTKVLLEKGAVDIILGKLK